MSQVLSLSQVASLLTHVDQRVRQSGCDHTCRYSRDWAEQNGVDWDDLQDALDEKSIFCDCEVVLNLEEAAIEFDSQGLARSAENRWKLPDANPGVTTEVSRWIVARDAASKNNYARAGEWLLPAPFDRPPRKRMRKTFHYFIGVDTGLPAEIGFVTEIEPQPFEQFVAQIAESAADELKPFDQRVVSFVLQRIARLKVEMAVAADLREINGVTGKRHELNVHRVILRS